MKIRSSLRAYATDERGVMTFWLLTWSIVFIGFAGLAVDVANAYRTRAMLQATADAAAHAGAIELVKAGSGTVKDRSTEYARKNMASDQYGDVLRDAEVTLGHWDVASASFSTDPTLPTNAVRAVTRRAGANSNAVPTSLLRIIDLESWNVAAQSIASLESRQCSDQANRIVALGIVDMTTNWEMGGDLCVHGETGVAGRSGNSVQMPSNVMFSMLDTSTAPNAAQVSADHGWGMASCGNCSEDQKYQNSAEDFVNVNVDVEGKIAAIRDDMFDVVGAATDEVVGPVVPLLNHKSGSNDLEPAFAAAVKAGSKTFYITCVQNQNGNFGTFALDKFSPDPTVLEGVTIYSGPDPLVGSGKPCNFTATGAQLGGVTIVTTSTALTSISLTGQPTAAAAAGGCKAYDEGLRLLSYGGVQVTASADFPTLQIVAKKDVRFSAKLQVRGSIELVTAGNVTLTSAASGGAKGILAPTCGYVGGSVSPYFDSVHIVF